jgi:sulfite exporter TauE/SafE
VAEQAVALVLMAIGLWVLWDIRQRRLHIHFHVHDGLPGHAHWHAHQHANNDQSAKTHQHDHRPLMVGMLHGIAGSAPLLGLLPASNSQSAWFGMAYLVFFGIGVFITMLLFGGVLGRAMEWLANWGERVITLTRLLVASFSIGMGGYLMLGTLK